MVFCKIFSGSGEDPYKAAEKGHKKRSTDTLVTDIGNDEADFFLFTQRKDIIEISRNITCGLKISGQLPALRFRKYRGEKPGLDLTADFQFTLGHFSGR